ncbi:MFS-type Sugar/inositol transporter [Penicillium ucsense]|uniref:MFS-type Sugar/inositol transporter n=1 Tax=Penicillium ucsense TaxID=2839758 RepID=A0A8J8VX29_9EURO|nr:MFS-type Sugar/inositol transporter [Penicillium ucsense]KAF7734088.1 MFS-type Sugar/inositol transporter [Penicillium ucsense]
MALHDENESSGPDAPLLAESNAFRQGDSEAPSDDGHAASELQYLGGWFIWSLTFSAGLSGLLFGYDTGVISSTLVTVGSDLSGRPLTTLDESLITSCTSLFALIACPFTGVLGDKYGRRRIILYADVLFALGAILQASTSQVWGMIAGRSVVGLAVGSASAVTPLYISEVAPSHIRGRLVVILALLITGGQVVAYIVGWLFSQSPGGWRWIVGLGAASAFLQFATILLLPETPRWLMKMGLERKAVNVLRRIYRNSPSCDQIIQQVMRSIKDEIAAEKLQSEPNENQQSSSRWFGDGYQRAHSLFGEGANRRALTIAMMLQALQQLCGFNSLMYFSGIIFSALSFSSPTLTSLTVAGTNFVFTLVAFVFIDRIGRRRILLYSVPVMVIALILCALAFTSLNISLEPQSTVPGQETSSAYPVIILICLTIFTAAYAFGIGNVPWQQSELFPLNVRSIGSGLATATNWGCNFIVGLTFLPMMKWLSPTWTFAVYALVCAVGWLVIRGIYPEMSGLGLEEVRGLLSEGWGVEQTLRRQAETRHEQRV